MISRASLAAMAALLLMSATGCGLCAPWRGMGYGPYTQCGCEVSCGCEPACGCESSCACEPGCGCEPGCACEPGCGCEPSCGCATGRFGRRYAFDRWQGDCNCQGPKWNFCTGPRKGSCGCGCAEPACDVSCGCEPGCDVGCGCSEPCCGCGDSCCGCGDSCGCGCGNREVRLLGNGFCYGFCAFRDECRRALRPLRRCFGCGGCDGELYWSPWHNDPPRCCDPCDSCGNWIGPSSGYRAPYDHSFGPRRASAY